MMRSTPICKNTPNESVQQIVRYSMPISRISGSSATNALKNGRTPNRPNSRNASAESSSTNRPLVAALLASSKRRWPSRREISAFMPTPVPTATAIISIWIG